MKTTAQTEQRRMQKGEKLEYQQASAWYGQSGLDILTVPPENPSEIIHPARKIEFESCELLKNGKILNLRKKKGIIRP